METWKARLRQSAQNTWPHMVEEMTAPDMARSRIDSKQMGHIEVDDEDTGGSALVEGLGEVASGDRGGRGGALRGGRGGIGGGSGDAPRGGSGGTALSCGSVMSRVGIGVVTETSHAPDVTLMATVASFDPLANVAAECCSR